MTDATWEKGPDQCLRCGNLTELLKGHNMAGHVLILARRCTTCRWRVDLSGDLPRKVKYVGP